jgi:hypothetical protein
VSQVSVKRLPSMRPCRLAAALVCLVGAFGVAGCKEVETESATTYTPDKLEEVKGSKDDLKRVSFTAEAAKRTGLRTAPIRHEGGRRVVPYDALLYRPDGSTYVYTTSKPLEYVRAEVKVDRIDGDRVLVTKGPPAGTDVVTVGAVEVYGAELEIAGSH